MNTCIILRGIPTSGKSTFAESYTSPDTKPVKVICCDEIRYELYGKSYKFSKEKEDKVWKTFYSRVATAANFNQHIIIDNTNIKLSYINRIVECLNDRYTVIIKEFPIPTWKAYYRNVLRYVFTGKFIPWNVIKGMQEGYWSNRSKIEKEYELL